jgi:hypothetical protein
MLVLGAAGAMLLLRAAGSIEQWGGWARGPQTKSSWGGSAKRACWALLIATSARNRRFQSCNAPIGLGWGGRPCLVNLLLSP